MKPLDKYLMFVQWSDEDGVYVGYCPDLFPSGGVCHGVTRVEAYQQLSEIVEDMVASAVEQGLDLPEARTRAMREVEIAA